MSPLELLLAAINGQPAARIPIFCNLFDQGAKALGLSQSQYYASGERVAWAETGKCLSILSHYISPISDLAEAKAIIGQRGLTCGVIDDIKMINCTSEQLRAKIKRLCAIAKPGGHFLFGTGVMPMAIPEANIKAMIDAAFEYGVYP